MSTTLRGSRHNGGSGSFLGSTPLTSELVSNFITEVAHAASGGDTSLTPVVDVVAEAVQAFLEANGVAHVAARKVGRQFRRLCVAELPSEIDSARLTRAFERAQSAALVAARQHFEPHLDHDRLIQVLDRIVEYLQLLHDHAGHGLAETHRLRELASERQHEELRRALFRSAEPIDILGRLTGHDPEATYVAVIAVDDVLPKSLLEAPDTMVGSRREALVAPELLEDPQVVESLQHRVVTGPPLPLEAVPEAVEMARRAARLLRSGAASHEGPVVPCDDLICHLAVGGSPLLNELAARKHLESFNELRTSQVLDYAELLLLWLERGQPLNHIANSLNLPPQTVHHRFTVLRRLYGEQLDDPNTRLELLLALRHALPRWRANRNATVPTARRPRRDP
ncbi:helix-turn-helix domain-containing protein [Nocardioides sp.]|jgi:hypothetical protein|uniref:helix-turn-helix domain-containing protein n=1 Tax=Nocardioides sp. TaxID=35761 RepID=UPI002C98214A|nr:helix-turn-helix domain-containing protein [Nocardioides sp.]HVX54026.1 helix-turn-helix domain-containing protein [Nocardioides sp.]